jgi:transcriptional accessory protein Tex/SPT6
VRPKTVYSTSLDEAKVEAQTPLLVNINTADAKELDELPGVGPSTAQNIIDHCRHRGSFKFVDELAASIRKYENQGLRFRALLTTNGAELELARV